MSFQTQKQPPAQNIPKNSNIAVLPKDLHHQN